MPLNSGNGRATISHNISELTHHGSRPRSHDQIVAIALHNADQHPRARGGIADAGHVSHSGATDPEPFHPGGLFHSDVAGRTDRLPRKLPGDSFVFPADVISALGQGNTMAGAKIMDGIVGSTRLAEGGAAGPSSVIVAGGEYSVPPDRLADIGRRRRAHGLSKTKSDLNAGHEWAREFVGKVRKHQMKFLRNAPEPKK